MIKYINQIILNKYINIKSMSLFKIKIELIIKNIEIN